MNRLEPEALCVSNNASSSEAIHTNCNTLGGQAQSCSRPFQASLSSRGSGGQGCETSSESDSGCNTDGCPQGTRAPALVKTSSQFSHVLLISDWLSRFRRGSPCQYLQMTRKLTAHMLQFQLSGAISGFATF